MGKSILIVNGHQRWDMSPGGYNASMTSIAEEVLAELGNDIRVSRVDSDWDVNAEINQFVWADDIIFQFPIYWFGVPWGMKKYIDEVFMIGRGKIFDGDGRTRSDPSKRYGTGGLLAPRRYMLSTTWNAPKVALDEPDQLFEGRGADGVLFWLHKTNEFCGLSKLPSFECNDIMKNPDYDNDVLRWRAHLKDVFGTK